MWQNINISDMAKQYPSALQACLAQHARVSEHLRDFSMRQLPDEAVEILLPDADDEQQESEAETDVPQMEGDMPEMAPFSLDKASRQENEAETAIDIAAIEREAFARGQSAAQADYEVIRAELVETHQRALAEARQTTINALAGDLVAACIQGFAALQDRIEHNIARLIAALAGEKFTRDAVAEFVQTLSKEVMDASMPLILEGDQKLLDAFIVQAKSAPTIDLNHYQLKVQAGCQLRLIIGDEVVSTRLSPLLQQLRDMI